MKARSLYVCIALMMLAGCSMLVEPEHEVIACAPKGGKDPCPGKTVCSDGQCKVGTCAALEICNNNLDDDCDKLIDEPNNVPETCDHIDNNCNNETDEGHDIDRDGTPWCDNNHDRNSADCDDYNPSVYPKAPEICDGLDNDCNGKTDDAPLGGTLCAGGKTCAGGQCIVPNCASDPLSTACPNQNACVEGTCLPMVCPAVACGAGKKCDLTTGTCVNEEKLNNGKTCIRSTDCKSGLCGEGSTMRVSDGRICLQACCDDSMCGLDEVCIASGTGARSCMPRENYVNTPRHCTSKCTDGLSCVVTEIARGNPGFPQPAKASACHSNIGTVALGGPCFVDDSVCASGVCIPGPTTNLLFGRVCSMPCGSSQECTPLTVPKTNGDTTTNAHAYCRYIKPGLLPDLFLTQKDWITVCALDRGETNPAGRMGSACSSGRDCADGACVGAVGNKQGVCAPTCCSDAQCKSLGDDTARCLPVPRGGDVYEMRCLRTGG